MTPGQLLAINAVLLAAVVIAALWTIITARIVYAAVGLALTSATIAIVMFMLSSPVAGVFELSVCAGLIPAIFLSAISVARRMTATAETETARDQLKRFWPLPIIVVLVCIVLLVRTITFSGGMPGHAAPAATESAGQESNKPPTTQPPVVPPFVSGPAFPPLPIQAEQDVRTVFWSLRHMEIIGQIVILLAGAFAVVVLLKEPKNG